MLAALNTAGNDTKLQHDASRQGTTLMTGNDSVGEGAHRREIDGSNTQSKGTGT